MARRAATGLALAAALVTAGCGSSSTSRHTSSAAGSPPPAAAAAARATTSSTAGPALSRRQYITRADSLCRRAQSRTPPFPGTKSGNGFATVQSLVVPYLTKIASLTSSTVDGLRALHPPDALRATADQMLAAEQARLRDLGDALTAAQANDGAGFTAAFQQDQHQDGPRFVASARALGVKACAAGL